MPSLSLWRSCCLYRYRPKYFKTPRVVHVQHSGVMTEKKEDSGIDDLVKQVAELKVKEEDEDSLPPSLRTVADWIQNSSSTSKSKSRSRPPRILVLSGAGVSVAAGIPDFRTPGTGLYDNLQKYNLPYPEAVFDVHFYRKNPRPFCALAKEIWPGITHSPTLTHSFLSLLSQKGMLLRNYSQNIDGLEYLAGLDEEHIVECHGHFRTASCIECDHRADGEKVKHTILDDGKTPTCRECGGNVKPDIVFFGESLPDRFHKLLKGDVAEADLLLVMGTSLQVAPVSMIPNMVSCKRALFNMDQVMRLRGKDVFVEGDIDSNVLRLCRMLGWEEELMEQNRKTRIQVNDTKLRRGKKDKA